MWLAVGCVPAARTLGEAFDGPGPISSASGTLSGSNSDAGGSTTTGARTVLSPIVPSRLSKGSQKVVLLMMRQSCFHPFKYGMTLSDNEMRKIASRRLFEELAGTNKLNPNR